MPFKLHAVVVKKDKTTLPKAKKIASDIIKNPHHTFYRETEDSYRFRDIPKTKFNKNTFRSKPVNSDITLVFGELKNDKKRKK